jgi:hypothetical protein
MDSIFSAPLDNLHTKKINCHGTVRPNRKEMLKSCGHTMKLKWGDKDYGEK